MVANRPPMGWNTWNTFGWEINEELVKQSADTLVESGLAECGYNYIVIDDCWALFSSPLMIGCDIRDMDEQTSAILKNRDIIEINQDEAGCVPFSLLQYTTESTKPIDLDRMVYAKVLENGDVAIGIFNFSEEEINDWSAERIELDAIGLPESLGKTLIMKELFTGKEIKVINGIYRDNIKPHTCRLYRCKVVDAK